MNRLDHETKHALCEALVATLLDRPTSAFGRGGGALARTQIAAILDAFADDFEGPRARALRSVGQDFVAAYAEHELGFFDLRLFAKALREAILEVLGHGPPRERGEALLYDFALILSMRFIADQNERAQAENARRELSRAESQLAELELALAEKTELLELIRQASVPIAPITAGILVVPLVGTFERVRAELLGERLLAEVSRARARTVILDITGAPLVDTMTAQLILSMARSIRLLGAQLLLVGMSPDAARTVVSLGVELHAIETFANLQDGLARALRLQGMAITRVGVD